ncbi:uncharacterized protein N7496_010955 [Penicillium cataractarum]|uniref:Methyltransferase domain-containing protein n=1 Tax=Penicillium cataractarum TaxID=2100454 RepID=A0A9W9UV53_9EURO|nr:uncharacterized protein N7496_010955 [Penicillium cataractarum]KAJ5358542.1 hypothetical protein N7496_010955 [Penicillium cataractarum]
MPRIPTSLLLKAYRENPLLSILLKECRSLDTARNELRWIRERALRDAREHSPNATGTRLGWRTRLRTMCHKRSQGVPLQYILGDQPFGDLEILCRRGVLIPRSDTESYTYEAARLVRQMALETDKNSPSPSSKTRPLRILDLCTGTGCIALLLHALLASHFERIQIMGLDLSPIALNLAQRNLEHNIGLDVLGSRAREEIRFHRADVLSSSSSAGTSASTINDGSIPTVEDLLSKYTTQLEPGPEPADGSSASLPKIDLLISNPPYISTTDFHNGTTARSVRLFEPRLALVPPHVHANTDAAGKTGDKPEDIFYRRILGISLAVRASITVLECGDRMQAERVVGMFSGMRGQQGRMGEEDGFTAEVWPNTEEDCLANGFHRRDGSRCVVIRRGRGGSGNS